MLSAVENTTEYLFSYGTLQMEAVQIATFGRILEGAADQLPEFSVSMVAIDDQEVVRTSGKTHHPIICRSGKASDAVSGTVFKITHQELLNADRYEVKAYKRVGVRLASGIQAWVYVSADD